MSGISPDGALVGRALAGDAQAAEDLAARHVHGAWRAAYAITGSREAADDAVQEGFERAFRNLESFDRTRPFAPWLARIVVNRALSLRPSGPETVEFQEHLHGVGDDDRTRHEIRESLQALDPDRRAVVVLRVVAGFSPNETADILGVAVGTIHSRLHRALDDLRRDLEVPAR